MDLYAEQILDHYRHPRNSGELKNASADHEEVNHACGDQLHLWLVTEDGTVTNAKWTGEGCAICMASMSLLSEELIGKTEDEVNALTKEHIYELLGVPIGSRRFKCALMSLHVTKNTLRKVKSDEPLSWTETVALDE